MLTADELRDANDLCERALQRGERLDSLATAVRALAEEVRDRAGNDHG